MLSAGEEADNYKDVVATRNPEQRVIPCRDGLQSIVQRHKNKRPGAPIWSSLAFCATKERLLLRIKGHLQETFYRKRSRASAH